MDSQLENIRPSGLKQPSRLPAFTSNSGRTLAESTQSDINTRNGLSSMMQPPGVVPSKHRIPGLIEPATKRKTLAERAGEPINPARHHGNQKHFASQSVSRLPGAYNIGNRPVSASSISSLSGLRPASRANGNKLGASRNVAVAEACEDEDESDAGLAGNRKAWDTNGRLEDMEHMYKQLKSHLETVTDSRGNLEESLALYKSRVEELSQLNRDLTTANRELTTDLERARNDLHMTSTDLRQVRRDNERDLQDTERRHERDLHDLASKHKSEIQALESDRKTEAMRAQTLQEDAKAKWQRQRDNETADMTTTHWEELEELRTEHEKQAAALRREVDDLRRSGESRATESASEVQTLREELAQLKIQADIATSTATSLRDRISAEESRNAALELEKTRLISKAHFLEGNQEAQSHEFTTMSQKLQDAINERDATLATLQKEESVRRQLNNTILELRGNIRVFVRTRPMLEGEADAAKVEYPDAQTLDGGKEMVVHAPTTLTATGKERNEKHSYAFDRAFVPGTPNLEVFDDCKDLIQSVVDGYNVSILSYGQTGSGKTYGMSGPHGIIPSSIRMLLMEIRRLRGKGWQYAVEASFVEVYNETLNDLLGDAKTWDDDEESSKTSKRKERHEIHHDASTGKTTVTNLSSVALWPIADDACDADVASDDMESANHIEQAVTQLLETAAKNRRVAATKANERSSRSHSVFILTLRGHCTATNEDSEGILNLVDLAGSERLKQSGAEGNRMKETQAINKSLSSLGDVIASLGNKSSNSDAHIPYRNSKLTYLLQSSLGGTTSSGKSSRTLMLLHLSPLQQHWQESRSSLLFGSKVHGTHIGTAKKR